MYCDARHPRIAAEIADAVGAVLGTRTSIRRSRQSRVLVVERDVSVARHAAVAKLDAFVAAKS